MYPRIKNTAHVVVYAFQCSRRSSRRPGKSSSKTTWLQPAGCGRFRAAWASLRHSVGAACLLPRPGGRGQHQLLGPPGQQRPQAGEHGTRLTLQTGQPLLDLSGGSSDDLPDLGGLQGQPVHPQKPSAYSAFFRKISLRMTHTGESVWMERRRASRGPKAGSTSPSATPL